MADFAFGPVEFYLIGLEGDRPSPGVIEALTELIDAGSVRLLDFLLVSKSDDGQVTVVEIDENPAVYGFDDVEFAALGLAGDEDVDDLAALVSPGSTAAIVVLELAWASRLAGRLAESRAEVLSVERIPAPVVNALIESVAEES